MKKGFTCFLIDDDTDDQEIFLSVMEQIAPTVRCVTATNGYEAIQKLTTLEVKPDIIFVDLNMPRMNGKEFLQECTSLGLQNIPVIILTTTSDQNSIEETLKLGAAGYITKPDRFNGWGTIIKEKIHAFGWVPDPLHND